MPLFLVATPIGNRGDITLRALEILRDADIIACEDTRHTRRLLDHHQITGKRLISYHEHNEKRRAGELVQELQAGRNVAVVSNAGTPLISDPGFRLTSAAHDAGVPVIPLPGPCAAVAALTMSGLPVHRFTFMGFPPKGPGKLRSLLAAERDNPGSLIFYESPNRLQKLLAAISEVYGATRVVAVARELTKLHEELRRGTVAELLDSASELKGRTVLKGEMVVVVAPSGYTLGESET